MSHCFRLASGISSRHRSAACKRQVACRALRQQDVQEYLAALAVDEIGSAEELRAAYYERMRDLHPDVNPERDTTEEAAAVNEAYAALTEVLIRCLSASNPGPGCNRRACR